MVYLTFWIRYLSEIFCRHSWDVLTIFPNTFNFLYVSQYVCWLTFSLKLGQYRYISCTGWDIFLKIFGRFPGINLQLFQIILNFVYVCQSISWLTFLLKLDKKGYLQFLIRYLSENFWTHSWDVNTLVPNDSKKIRVSLSLLTGLLPYWNSTNEGISPVPDEISFWNFLKTFLVRIQVMSGQVRSDPVRSGQLRSGQYRSAPVSSD